MLQPMEVRMVFIAGADAAAMRMASMALFNAGHLPVIVDELAAPLLAGLDGTVEEVLHPLSERMLARCDAVLRVEGASAAADDLVGLARARGLRVFFSLQEAIDA
jgi:hypothetical protein